MSRLPRHTNITAYFGSYLGPAKGSSNSLCQLHLVMEFCGGGTLYDALNSGRAIEPMQRSRIATGIAAGLAAIHGRTPPILHQGLSTNNVLLSADGEAKLADFGLARLRAGSASFNTMHLRGTPHYMAPEVWEGTHITEKVDVYALGMVLYEIWAGAVPWAGARVNDIGKRVVRGERPSVRGVLPLSLVETVPAAFAQLPAQRPTAASLSVSLRARDESLRALVECSMTAFESTSTATMHQLLRALGYPAESGRPSQLHQAARAALRAEGLARFE